MRKRFSRWLLPFLAAAVFGLGLASPAFARFDGHPSVKYWRPAPQAMLWRPAPQATPNWFWRP